MAFLEKEELKTVAPISLIDKLTNLDDTIVADIITESIGTMKGYMSRYYDVEAIFAAAGAARHQATLKRLKDIVIYEIYESHTREQNAVAARRYNEAINWLEKLNTGEFGDKTLPTPAPIEETPGTTGENRYGGNPRYKTTY